MTPEPVAELKRKRAWGSWVIATLILLFCLRHWLAVEEADPTGRAALLIRPLTVVLTVIYLVVAYHDLVAGRAAGPKSGDRSGSRRHTFLVRLSEVRNFAMVVLLLVLYAGALPLAGYRISSAIFIPSLAYALGYRKVGPIGILTLTVTMGTYWIFGSFLSLSLPTLGG